MDAVTRMSRSEPGSAHPVKAVSVISTGTVRIRSEQVYGTPQPLYRWLLASRQWTPPRPINVYVIGHARGLVPFDTGQDRASVTDAGYFPGGLTGHLSHRLVRFSIGEDDTHRATRHPGLRRRGRRHRDRLPPARGRSGAFQRVPGRDARRIDGAAHPRSHRGLDVAAGPLYRQAFAAARRGSHLQNGDPRQGRLPGVGNRRRLAESSRQVLALAEQQPGPVVLPSYDPTAARPLLDN